MGLGVRSRRYALLAEDGVVKVLNLVDGGAFTFSVTEDLLKLKEWAKAQDINDPKSGSLSSYALCLLVIFHFQLKLME
ncbi:hypothetical protein ZIOFF_073169 [Zingiber officinale]|uniref:Uncharacterized protein n=1 Tax=Zingiber officinale TaxID=94328 RepID=A0A8J5EP33_ZINOF|nr:hypothetical protein ZIOFF_073169 [Zingiber officinale]